MIRRRSAGDPLAAPPLLLLHRCPCVCRTPPSSDGNRKRLLGDAWVGPVVAGWWWRRGPHPQAGSETPVARRARRRMLSNAVSMLRPRGIQQVPVHTHIIWAPTCYPNHVGTNVSTKSPRNMPRTPPPDQRLTPPSATPSPSIIHANTHALPAHSPRIPPPMPA